MAAGVPVGLCEPALSRSEGWNPSSGWLACLCAMPGMLGLWGLRADAPCALQSRGTMHETSWDAWDQLGAAGLLTRRHTAEPVALRSQQSASHPLISQACIVLSIGKGHTLKATPLGRRRAGGAASEDRAH